MSRVQQSLAYDHRLGMHVDDGHNLSCDLCTHGEHEMAIPMVAARTRALLAEERLADVMKIVEKVLDVAGVSRVSNRLRRHLDNLQTALEDYDG